MKKENRVIVNYLDSLIDGLKEVKKEISKCEPHEILDYFEKLDVLLESNSEKADKVEKFMYKLRTKEQRKKDAE